MYRLLVTPLVGDIDSTPVTLWDMLHIQIELSMVSCLQPFKTQSRADC